MTELLAQWDLGSLLLGLLTGLLIAALAAGIAWRRGIRSAMTEQQPALETLAEERDGLIEALDEERQKLVDSREELAITSTRLEEQQVHFKRERANLEEAEKRLSDSFERLAGRVFDERTKQFNELSEKQMEGLLKPLTKDLNAFRSRVDETHLEEVKQHAALRERLTQLEGLNEKLNTEARNLSRALTSDVKAQGGWGEQQLEKLLELSGLRKGENYHTQYSVTGRNGERLQPDLVLLLPEGRTIVMDSKVSLTAWTRYQAADDDAERERQLNDHVKSVKAHIDGLSGKNYADAEELNALDFVLMFMPIESALIAALHHDPTLPEYALERRVALLSPANFLATVRTVASVWMIHKQNTNARDIASRAGHLYDKFVGFTDNLKQLGSRLNQAQSSFDSAMKQLSSGTGNLVGQADKLRALGAKHNKQLDAALVEKAAEAEREEDPPLKLVRPEDESG